MKHFCREASRLMSDGYERELSLAERIRLRLHLWMCDACNNYGINLKLMRRLLGEMRTQADKRAPCLSEKDRQHILAGVQNRAQPEA